MQDVIVNIEYNYYDKFEAKMVYVKEPVRIRAILPIYEERMFTRKYAFVLSFPEEDFSLNKYNLKCGLNPTYIIRCRKYKTGVKHLPFKVPKLENFEVFDIYTESVISSQTGDCFPYWIELFSHTYHKTESYKKAIAEGRAKPLNKTENTYG